MTPKEKAEKMVLMFEQCQSKEIIGINYDTAVRSAKLCCNIILQPFLINHELISHWQQVKQEIEKL